ncbi:zinc finger BED domain-containing protein RICESLEEPER 1-like [Morus notabilis]|uniref:zinc finger BED domain-containing protein RICESLEEPER 1-like n=1 Tax=Morus notabilis TaxID=981085 RepID=UPI000CED280C|nr:zinc finger BED domain-containing protein RICESLEEPER 1-like [Morus notabilis]
MVIVDELSFRFAEGLKDLHNSIAAIRNAMRYVRSSPARLLKFKSCVEREKIEYKGLVCLDVPTRWNSSYMMLDAAIKFQKAFERYEEEDNATLNVTSNSYFHELCEMQNQLSKLSKQEDSMLSFMAVSMKKKYDKYWGNVENINYLLFVAIVLDPRYKMDYLTYCFSIMYDSFTSEILAKNVKDTMYRLHEVYSGDKGGSVANESSGEATTTSTTEVKTEVEEKGCLWSSFVRKIKEKNVNEYKNDMDRYLTDHIEDPTRSNFDVLVWWKNNATNYKVLSLVARDILVIPVSTVALESAFSTEGRILDPFRSSLSPKMVEALICTQNWLCSREHINIIDVEDFNEYEDIESDLSNSVATHEGQVRNECAIILD